MYLHAYLSIEIKYLYPVFFTT